MRPMPELDVRIDRVEDLVPYAGNAKEHDAKQVHEIANSIREFGMNDPVGIWHDSQGRPVIVEGHGRVLALKELGEQWCPVIALDHLSDEQRRAYVHVHNQTTLTSGFDLEALVADLGQIDGYDWEDFGFEIGEPSSWFDREERDDKARQDGNDEYNEFLEKFEPKKTTDDCYTPPKVYDAVADWVAAEWGLDRASFVRPFYPGGDFEREEYPDGCVVVDNPPFSLMVRILEFYQAQGIRFFLFAPTLTLFSGHGRLGVCYMPSDCNITYENGAMVNTSFITNLDAENVVRTAPSLRDAVMASDRQMREEQAKPVNLKYAYPPYVVTAAMVSTWCKYGVEFRLPRCEAQAIGLLDAQREYGKGVFGGGFLISERAKADAERAKADAERAKADAERAKADAERAKALEAAKALGDGLEVRPDGTIVWPLSDREMRIVDRLGRGRRGRAGTFGGLPQSKKQEG